MNPMAAEPQGQGKTGQEVENRVRAGIPTAKRLLLSSDIPMTLWHRNERTLLIPGAICRTYKEMLAAKGLLRCAQDEDCDDGPVGGITEEDTRKHFATRFSGSVARTQLAVLDPMDELRGTSDLFVRALGGGRVGLLDIPCGAGAASIDLLAATAALREARRIPRQPLEVRLVAGDISECARVYALDMIEGMKEHLACQGIFVHEKIMEWNVLDAESTTALLHSWMEWAHDCREYIAILANFSGFLQKHGRFKDAQPQLNEIFRWTAQRRSTIVWIEPATNDATQGFIPRVLKWFQSKLPTVFAKRWDKARSLLSSTCYYLHPINVNSTPRVHLNLIRLEGNDP
jgi:hypothetical protein